MVTEELVSRLLPYIVKGLKSSYPDYKAASYMIVGQLASKVTMEKQLCNSLLEITTKVRLALVPRPPPPPVLYDKCLKFVSSTLKDPVAQTFKTRQLTLNPADILIVNFAVRTMESLSVTPSLKARLKSANIPLWSFGEDPELFMNCTVMRGK